LGREGGERANEGKVGEGVVRERKRGTAVAKGWDEEGRGKRETCPGLGTAKAGHSN